MTTKVAFLYISCAAILVWPSFAVGQRARTSTQVFNYVDFSDVSNLTLNGSAQQGPGLGGITALWLTPPTYLTAGSAWYNNPVNVEQGFVTEFRFAVRGSADGFAFVIQNIGLAALGGDGGDMGYAKLANSLAVEFDTWWNPEFDPNNNHIAVQSCGTASNTADHRMGCTLGIQTDLPMRIADGRRHWVVITYDPSGGGATGLLTIAVDKKTVLTSMLNLGTLLNLTGGDAWVGFSGGTGGATETSEILSWSFSSVAPSEQDRR